MWILGLKGLSNNVTFGYLNPSCDKIANIYKVDLTAVT